MKTTDTGFDLIGLHDARISSMLATVDRITIFLREAYIGPDHPCNTTDDWILVEPAELAFCGLVSHESRTWNDQTSSWSDSSTPVDLPIADEIMESSRSDSDGHSIFTLTGFGASGWTEWFIHASGFRLSWDVESQPRILLKPKT